MTVSPTGRSLDPDSPKAATILDGIAFAAFVDALAAAMHELPGRRRLLQVDGGSVANACWSIGPMDGGKRNHTWDLLPCPVNIPRRLPKHPLPRCLASHCPAAVQWIVNIWQLGALAASKLDVMIPMDSCNNTHTFPPQLDFQGHVSEKLRVLQTRRTALISRTSRGSIRSTSRYRGLAGGSTRQRTGRTVGQRAIERTGGRVAASTE